MKDTDTTAMDWDRPIRGPLARDPGSVTKQPVSPPTVEHAIAAWLAWRGFASSTERRIHEHLESARARGWREHRGITTIEGFSAADAADYVIYMRERGAEPATLRKLRTLFLGL